LIELTAAVLPVVDPPLSLLVGGVGTTYEAAISPS